MRLASALPSVPGETGLPRVRGENTLMSVCTDAGRLQWGGKCGKKSDQCADNCADGTEGLVAVYK